VILTQEYLLLLLLPRQYALLLTGAICDRDIIVEICILMLCSNKILQTKTLHYM